MNYKATPLINYIAKYSPLLIAAVVWTVWAIGMQRINGFALFADNWFMSMTMAAGSFIAGSTSQGGGAVAFPVMTLVFDISPATARDFSLMIQTIGMGAASLVILLQKMPTERHVILTVSLGGVIGVFAGITLLSPLFLPAYVKMFFTSLWISFGFALYLINRQWNRKVAEDIRNITFRDQIIFFAAGVVGGAVSGVVGSGIDMLMFSVLVLYYRINEKTATYTSVVIMAINAAVGFAVKGMLGDIGSETWNYWLVCVPVVVIGAPLGAWFIKNRSIHFIVYMLCSIIVFQYITSLLLAPREFGIFLFSILVIVIGFILFWYIARQGHQRMAAFETKTTTVKYKKHNH